MEKREMKKLVMLLMVVSMVGAVNADTSRWQGGVGDWADVLRKRK